MHIEARLHYGDGFSVANATYGVDDHGPGQRGPDDPRAGDPATRGVPVAREAAPTAGSRRLGW